MSSTTKWVVGILVTIFSLALAAVAGVNAWATDKVEEKTVQLEEGKLDKAVFVEHKEAEKQRSETLQKTVDKLEKNSKDEFNKLGDKVDKILEKI